MQHPSITQARLTGYEIKEQHYEVDVLGNMVYLYDDVIAMPEGIYRADSLSSSELTNLLNNGGIYQQAE